MKVIRIVKFFGLFFFFFQNYFFPQFPRRVKLLSGCQKLLVEVEWVTFICVSFLWNFMFIIFQTGIENRGEAASSSHL